MFAGRPKHARAETEKALKEHGVVEPLYSNPEWNQFFAGAGLALRWHDVILSRGLRGFATRSLNGITKADYCLVATKQSLRSSSS